MSAAGVAPVLELRHATMRFGGVVALEDVSLRIDADWFQVLLGALLVAAVLFNDWVRRRAEAG